MWFTRYMCLDEYFIGIVTRSITSDYICSVDFFDIVVIFVMTLL